MGVRKLLFACISTATLMMSAAHQPEQCYEDGTCAQVDLLQRGLRIEGNSTEGQYAVIGKSICVTTSSGDEICLPPGGPYASCNAAGYTEIASLEECVTAGGAVPANAGNYANLPSKCAYGNDGTLWWNEAAMGPGSEVCGQNGRKCICAEAQAPAPAPAPMASAPEATYVTVDSAICLMSSEWQYGPICLPPGGPYATCNAAGYTEVASNEECVKAGSMLADDVPGISGYYPNLPSKCAYRHDGTLWWNEAAMGPESEACGQNFKCICAQAPA